MGIKEISVHVNGYDSLSKSEEFRILQSSDYSLRDNLVLSHLKIIPGVLRRKGVFPKSPHYEDCFQDCSVAVVGAVRSYRVEGQENARGISLMSYVNVVLDRAVIRTLEKIDKVASKTFSIDDLLEELEDNSRKILTIKDYLGMDYRGVMGLLRGYERGIVERVLDGEHITDIARKEIARGVDMSYRQFRYMKDKAVNLIKRRLGREIDESRKDYLTDIS